MGFQCFEIQIKTEADSNECPYDDKPSTGMFAVSDDIFSALSSSRGSVISCCGSDIGDIKKSNCFHFLVL